MMTFRLGVTCWRAARPSVNLPYAVGVDRSPVALIEFPADDAERALRFWGGLLGAALEPRTPGEGSGWQLRSAAPAVGVHERGRGPGDSFSLPYFAVDDLPAALARVAELGGSVVHPGDAWAVCRDSEGTPFGLAAGAEPLSGEARSPA
jgi:predicted enzyme related to lactoylglutathione lyase